MSSVRAFLAIPLPDHIKEAIESLQKQLQEEAGGVQWSRPEGLHLTVHFFGETGQENLEKVKASMLSVKRSLRPFKVNIKGLGGFPALRRPKVVWLGIHPQTQLKLLHGNLQQSLQEFGLSSDARAYSPHLTIGRVRKGRVDLTAAGVTLNDIVIGQLEINGIVLYQSILHPGGAEHRPIFSVNFDEETDNLPSSI
jgi:2'-5' RNA ligase